MDALLEDADGLTFQTPKPSRRAAGFAASYPGSGCRVGDGPSAWIARAPWRLDSREVSSPEPGRGGSAAGDPRIRSANLLLRSDRLSDARLRDRATPGWRNFVPLPAGPRPLSPVGTTTSSRLPASSAPGTLLPARDRGRCAGRLPTLCPGDGSLQVANGLENRPAPSGLRPPSRARPSSRSAFADRLREQRKTEGAFGGTNLPSGRVATWQVAVRRRRAPENCLSVDADPVVREVDFRRRSYLGHVQVTHAETGGGCPVSVVPVTPCAVGHGLGGGSKGCGSAGQAGDCPTFSETGLTQGSRPVAHVPGICPVPVHPGLRRFAMTGSAAVEFDRVEALRIATVAAPPAAAAAPWHAFNIPYSAAE